MTIQEARQQLQQQLIALYDEREATAIGVMVMERVTGWRRVDLTLNRHHQLTETQETQLLQFTQDLQQGQPIQYVLGETWFQGMRFRVNEHTLIPRPETEELVNWALETAEQQSATTCIDIGTGSGCIAISMKKRRSALEVWGVDVSHGALEVAAKNATQNDVQIKWQQMDILDTTCWNVLPVFDLIISNPPYIQEFEQQDMAPHVTQYEPHTALFVPDEDPLLFYRTIARLGQQHLTPGGCIFFEINQRLGKEVCDHLTEAGYQTELRKDLQGNDRMVKAEKSHTHRH